MHGRMALYGGGKMGLAMLEGWLDSGFEPKNIAVIDPAPSIALKQTSVHVNPENFDPDVIVLAVKPQIMPKIFEDVQFPNHSLIISVAAGVQMKSFEKALGAKTRMIRAMPNTPAAVKAGVTAIVGNKAASASDLQTAKKLLQVIGEVVILSNESDMDIVTGLSGSGPAYVFNMIEAMRDAGAALGLSEELAHELALATVAGAGKLAKESGIDAAQLRQNVTSPGGTTEAGLKVLMDETDGLHPLMLNTIKAAADRSKALGKNKS